MVGLVLLASACGGEGGDSEGSGEAGTQGHGETGGDSSGGPSGSGASVTEAVPTTGEAGTDTGEPEGTTMGAEPGECGGVAIPEPVNGFIAPSFLDHQVDAQAFSLTLRTEGDSHWVATFQLGASEPVVGTQMGLEVTGDDVVGRGSSGFIGTVTLELLAVTETCVVGLVSDVVIEGEATDILVKQMAGGFFAERRTF